LKLGLGDSGKAVSTESSNKGRIDYIDWLRGFAVVGMFEVHCYDAWLGGSYRQSRFFGYSQFSGSLPAPLFIFIAGVTIAMVVTNMRRKGAGANKVGARVIRRGAEVLGFGLLLRLQEFVLGWPAAPRTDLGRVDILNLIGVSIIMLGVLCWLVRSNLANAIAAVGVATAIAMLAPPLWTTHRLDWLPWYLESYINGVHVMHIPQSWLFPIFPWAAFAFAGLAVGLFLFSEWSTQNRGKAMGVVAAGAVAAFLLSKWFDSRPGLYAVYDYWHTSPEFLLARVGIVMGIMAAGYAWCRWGLGGVGFSPLKQLGQTSLLVYWVHLEFVYGRMSIVTQQAQTIWSATLGLIVIFAAMLALSIARTKLKGRSGEILARFRRQPQTAEGD
jgi:uncharacterized membrane protein